MIRLRRSPTDRSVIARDRRGVRVALALAGFVGLAASAQAQFKIVGPDGRVTYSDRPPAEAPAAARRIGNAATAPAASAPLPAVLRDPVARYPVTLYSANACDACDQARRYLRDRGIPFTERTVATAAEGELMSRSTGGTELPAVTIGSQPIRGYSPDEWGDYLDAAGYPQRSALPAGYQPPAATRLIPPPAAPTRTTEASPVPVAPPPAAPASTPDNPAGIRF